MVKSLMSRLAQQSGKSDEPHRFMKTTKPLFATLILTFGVLFHVQAQDPLTNRLVAYYPLNGNGNDQSGNGNHSTPAGNYTFVTNGLSGGALQIIGDNSIYYSGGGHALLPTFSSSMNTGFTFSVWAKVQSIGGNPFPAEAIITFGALNLPLAEIVLNQYTATPYLWFEMNGGSPDPGKEIRRNVDPQTIANSWNHIVMSYTPGTMAAYVNGQKVGETNATYNIFPVTKASIGRQWWDSGASSSARMDAVIDNVRIYNRALSSNEVATLYLLESGPHVDLIKAVKPALSGLFLGTNYQLQLSGDLLTWTNHGAPFAATNGSMVYPQYWDVDNWGKLFFRLQVAP